MHVAIYELLGALQGRRCTEHDAESYHHYVTTRGEFEDAAGTKYGYTKHIRSGIWSMDFQNPIIFFSLPLVVRISY